MKLILVTDNPELKSQEWTLNLILRDALYEFSANRGPTSKAYVDRRYPFWNDEQREKKTQEVENRKRLAEILHGINLEIKEEL